MHNTEIEIQVKVDRISNLSRFLKLNGVFVGKTRQLDKYFTPRHRNFTEVRPIKEWLRLRKSEKGDSINYKNWIYDKDGKSWHCDEYETKIEKLRQIEKIFNALNFKLLTTVDKTRKIWNYSNYEI